ncbi:MAG TPA: nucleotidyltransferase domain-containing protein [Solirubrobacterales bacterium]|nr:nucleotidyltransferase domain-containing protein [Solirubrobacterales bacterium]
MTTAEAGRIQTLEQRVKDFHGVDLAEVLDVIEYLRDGEDSILVGGSLAYGLGNHESDLDVVVAGPATGESSSRMPLEHFIESLRVDVWRLHQDEIDELFERAERGLASDAPLLGAFGHVHEQADLKLLHRVAYGVVIDGPALMPTATGDYGDVARRLLVREYAERMRHALYVAQLALAARRPQAAAMNARFGVEDALQALIAGRGLPFSDNKWLQLRLERDVPDLRDVYRPFAVLPDGLKLTAEFVAAAIAAVEALTGLELGLDALAADASWERGDLRLHRAGALRVLLSEGQDVAFELDAAEADAWESLGEEERWACAGRTDAESRLLFGLYAQGVAGLVWLRGLPACEFESNEEG